VYTLIIERLERHVLSERQVAMVARIGGAKKADLPTFDTEKAKVDRMIADVPRRQYPPDQAALIAALGLGG